MIGFGDLLAVTNLSMFAKLADINLNQEIKFVVYIYPNGKYSFNNKYGEGIFSPHICYLVVRVKSANRNMFGIAVDFITKMFRYEHPHQKNGKIRKNFAVFSLYSPCGGFHAQVRGILPLFIFIAIKITLTNH